MASAALNVVSSNPSKKVEIKKGATVPEAFEALKKLQATVAAALPTSIVTLQMTDCLTITMRFSKVEERAEAVMKINHNLIKGYRFTNLVESAEMRGGLGAGRLLLTATVAR